MKAVHGVFMKLGGALLVRVRASLGWRGGGDAAAARAEIVLEGDFTLGTQGWEAVFADWPVAATAEEYRLESGLRALPSGLGLSGTSFYLQGLNASDDLFMGIHRRVAGLRCCQAYQATFTLRFASEAPTGCVGVGGAPGEGVTLKVGASPKVLQVLAQGDTWALNVDKGNQSLAGSECTLAGNLANGQTDCAKPTWVVLERSVTHRFTVPADAQGQLTVFLGTDSGFEGLTRLHFLRVTVRLVPG